MGGPGVGLDQWGLAGFQCVEPVADQEAGAADWLLPVLVSQWHHLGYPLSQRVHQGYQVTEGIYNRWKGILLTGELESVNRFLQFCIGFST